MVWNQKELFTQLATMKVAIIGDLILDSYQWGSVDRISPEAPVPIVSVAREECRIGGAGNVALNLRSLEAEVQIFSIIGKDKSGKILRDLLEKNHIQTDYLFSTDERPTTNKTRIMARNQQIMRLDSEICTDISFDQEQQLIDAFTEYMLTKPDLVILEDYNKGVLTPRIIDSIITIAKKNQVIIAVDPKNKHFFNYKAVDIFKPNIKEVTDALHTNLENININNLSGIHYQLFEKLAHKISFITLSEKGVFYQSDKTKGSIIAAKIRNVADVSGAGDTVIAILSLIYACTKDIRLAAEMANIAGGLVCEEVGTAPIKKDRLLKESAFLFN